MGRLRNFLASAAIRLAPDELRASLQDVGHPSDTGKDWGSIFIPNGATSAAGAAVTPETAMRVSAVYACVRVIADAISSIPLKVYFSGKSGKEAATGHPLYQLLHDAPNNFQTSAEWRDQAASALCLRGNAYSVVRRDGAGRVVATIPVHPDKVRIYQDRSTLAVVYDVTWPDGRVERVSSQDLLHLRGLSSDGVVGLTPIALAREAIGLALTAEEHGARFFSNGARPGIVIKTPVATKPDQIEKLRAEWDKMHGGAFNAWRPALLYGGMEVQPLTMNATDAQFLETRKFQVTEIARIFRVPPHMIADLERATFSNIEHQAMEFVTTCIRPWVVRIEQRMNQVLLTPSERRTYNIEFSLEGLLRGDLKSRFEAYPIARNGGWMSPNDIRQIENMNRIEGGDEYMRPMNMTPLGTPPAAGGN